MYGRNRVNERDVPESQHTIFIRGLPGHLSTDEIREFFANDGSCSFDFVKVSPDRTKLYVAVRFDSKTVAREVMDKFGEEGKILGYDVELSWFRDIRRYLAHCAKQGIQPSRFRSSGGSGRGGRDFRDRDNDSGSRRRRTRSNSRSYTRSPERGAGEEAEERRSYSRSPTRSPRRSRSHSAGSRRVSRSRSRSAPSSGRSRSSVRSAHSDASGKKERSLSPSPPPRKSSKKKKAERKEKERKKRRYEESRSSSRGPTNQNDSDMSDGEILSVKTGTTGSPKKKPITVTLNKPIGPAKPQDQIAGQLKSIQQKETAQQSFTHRHLPAGSLAANEAAKSDLPLSYQKQAADSSSQQQQKFRQTLMVDLDSSSTSLPKFKPMAEDNSFAYQNGSKKDEIKRARMDLEMESPSTQMTSSSGGGGGMRPMLSPPHMREAPLANSVFKEIQRHILHDIRYNPKSELEEESHGSLRLSRLSKQRMTDEMREERIAKLSPEFRESVNRKKKQLELSYRNDCETFGLVTRKLLEKDRNLEDRLKISLLETMKDLERETLKQLDEFLDQFSYM